MKYFTQQWMRGDMTDEKSDAIVPAYWDYLATLLPKMPPVVRELATTINIHDGLIEMVVFDRAAQQLRLELLVGDLHEGYASIHLCYSSAVFETGTLKVIASDSESEALYDEVDVQPDGRFEHRILFWPYRELGISFGSLALTKVPRVDRKRANVPERFIET
jgi:hypothetical protein